LTTQDIVFTKQEIKPTETKPTETKPTETKPTESKESEKSTIQGQIPAGCSKVSIYDDITNKSIPSASVQLVNNDNEYSGLAKVNAYIDVPGYSTIFLPD